MSLRHSICCVAVLAASIACSKKDSEKEGTKAEPVSGTPASPAAAPSAAKQQSQGRAHLPEGCDLVTTIDWQRFRKMKSVKPDLEKEIADLKTATDEDAKQAAEFLKKADIDPLADPGDVAICLWRLEQLERNGTPGFVAIVGGKFRPGAAIEALDTVTERLKSVVRRAAAAATNEPSTEPEVLQIGGVKALLDKESGVFVAQAKDGAFVFGNDRARFEKALTPGTAHTGYKLSPEPVGVALAKSASGFVAQAFAGSPFAPATQTFEGAHMGFDDTTLRMEAHFGDAKHAALLKQGLDGLLASAPPGTAEGAKIQVKDKAVSVEVPLPEEVMGGMLQQLPGASPAPVRPMTPPKAPVGAP